MKIGISVKLDVTKIDKERLFKGEKGTYLDATTFIDLDELDQYGNNGFIAQSVSKEEREQGVKGNILGNVKVFFNDTNPQQQHPNTTQPPQGRSPAPPVNDFDDDLPFDFYERKSVV